MNLSKSLLLSLSIVCFVAVVAAGCGSGGSSGGESTPAATKFLEKTEKEVATLVSPKGTFQEPPADSPPPVQNKTVALISCGQTVQYCARGMKGAEDAAHALGWDTTLFDTKAEYSRTATGVRQAIVGGADAIFVYYIDCSFFQSALKEAEAAGIPVISAESFDCNQDLENEAAEPENFAGQVTYANDIPYGQYLAEWTMSQTKYVFAKNKGDMNAIYFNMTEGLGAKSQETYMKKFAAECGTCTINLVNFNYAEVYRGLESQASQALLKNPDADSMFISFELVATNGAAAAVKASGREIDLGVGEGGTPGVQLVKEGVGTVGGGLSPEWEAWSAIDCANRIFNDEKCVNSGIGQQVFTAEKNLPESGAWKPPVDFEALYEKAWGV
ncbi:MAG: sugar ABC transporter substrate-binding protein [Solirubrobacterales bacterium]